MSKYIMALDEGTTSCRCIIFDKQGNTVAVSQKEFEQIFPQPGWVEHDPMEIWWNQLTAVQAAMSKARLKASDIAAIGITNQRETTVVWDKGTGEPVYNAIVWQCRRTAEYCESIAAPENVKMIREKTGLPVDPYFSATKIRWILDNVEGARKMAEEGRLLFGTIETWLIWKLTGGRLHITDYSNASRTMLFNINTMEWDSELLGLFDIPVNMLPTPVSNSCIYGYTDDNLFGGPIAIGAAVGDQQSALFGQACFNCGEAKNTYGTGCFLLMNTGEKPVRSQHGLVTTVAWGLDGRVNYALEGSVFVAGAAIQWLRDEMKFFESSSDSEELAIKVPDSGGVYMVPAFTGLGAPYWNPLARGAIVGLTRGTNRNHIIRATLESLAFQTYDVIDAMEKDCEESLRSLKVDGGASLNNFLMQFQADILGCEVKRPECVETTALGAAYLAGLACGYWNDLEEIKCNWKANAAFSPELEPSTVLKELDGWHQAVNRVIL